MGFYPHSASVFLEIKQLFLRKTSLIGSKIPINLTDAGRLEVAL